MEEVTGSSPVSTTTKVVGAGATLTEMTSWSARQLADHYVSDTAIFRSNLVVSLDGHVADRAGSSRGLSNDCDVRVLRTLRALSDVVVVGGATARLEGYVPGRLHPEVATLCARPPRLAVLSRSLDFAASSALFQGDTPPVILTHTAALAAVSHECRAWLMAAAEIHLTDMLTGAWVRTTLESMGLERAVIEGGPAVQSLMREVVDELDVTLAPTLVGASNPPPAWGPYGRLLAPLSAVTGCGSTFLRLACLDS